MINHVIVICDFFVRPVNCARCTNRMMRKQYTQTHTVWLFEPFQKHILPTSSYKISTVWYTQLTQCITRDIWLHCASQCHDGSNAHMHTTARQITNINQMVTIISTCIWALLGTHSANSFVLRTEYWLFGTRNLLSALRGNSDCMVHRTVTNSDT